MIATFPIILFIIGAILLVALPLGVSLQACFRNRGRRTVICPDNREPVTVELDNKYAFATALRGQEHDGCNRARVGPKRATVARSVWSRPIRRPKTSSACCKSGTTARLA
jgi:hypothetical protein